MWTRYKVQIDKSNKYFSVKKNSNLFQELQKNNIKINHSCNGNYKCGKCFIKLIKGKANITDNDKLLLNHKQIKNNYHLACSFIIKSDIIISIPDYTESIQDITQDNLIMNIKLEPPLQLNKINNKNIYGIAVDIGTTTIVISLFNLKTGDHIATKNHLNSQNIYGTDLISRITYSLKKNNYRNLNKELIKSINNILKNISDNYNINLQNIFYAVFSSNAVMNHSLAGLSLENFSKYPFNHKKKQFKIISNSEINLHINKNAQCYIIPNIASFIGGDITSDIYTVSFKKNKIELLIDIGTNGEIVLNNKGELFCTSAAAGPAFEGGNIRFGMIAKKGAIYSADMDKKNIFEFKTIKNTAPAGICGTGLIDIISICINHNIIDLNGKINKNSKHVFNIDNNYAVNLIDKKIYITQKDIREFQLAKGAIQTGIKLLLKNSNLKNKNIDTIYLSGAFGNYLNIKKALICNFLPKIEITKYKFIGNGSLKGAQSALLNKHTIKKMEKLANSITHIDIASNSNFQDIFIKSLNF